MTATRTKAQIGTFLVLVFGVLMCAFGGLAVVAIGAPLLGGSVALGGGIAASVAAGRFGPESIASIAAGVTVLLLIGGSHPFRARRHSGRSRHEGNETVPR